MKQIIILLAVCGMQAEAIAQENTSAIEYQDAYSVYITRKLSESRDFYIRWLDFEVTFEASWFVYLQSKGAHKVSLALIDEKHPSTPPSYGSFNGRGSFLTLQVADAASTYERLKNRNAPITYDLKAEPWGQVRFGLTDPNGLYIDVVQQTEPQKGYWEKYPAKH